MVVNPFSNHGVLPRNFQGINCHMESMFMNVYIRCHVYTQAYVCVSRNVLLCRTFSVDAYFWSTKQLLTTLICTVALCMLSVAMGVLKEYWGSWENMQNFHSIMAISALLLHPGSLSLAFQPGISFHTEVSDLQWLLLYDSAQSYLLSFPWQF